MAILETQRLVLLQPDETIVDKAVTRAYSVLGHWTHRGFGLFTVIRKDDGAYVGMTGPYFPPGRPETEIGWILFNGYEKQGYATEAARAAIDYARTVLNWKDIVHYIDSQNTGSVAVAERLGAKLDSTAKQPKPENPCLVYRQPCD